MHFCLSFQLEVWYSGIMLLLVPQTQWPSQFPKLTCKITDDGIWAVELYCFVASLKESNICFKLRCSKLVITCGCIYLRLCMYVLKEGKGLGSCGKRGLKEVSSCPLVTLELVTAYFLLFSHFCPPTWTTPRVAHFISHIWPLTHTADCSLLSSFR